MAFPLSHPSGHASPHPAAGPSPALNGPSQTRARCQAASSPAEGDHQLEKLEFALAVALTRGDLRRSEELRDAIAALGGNQEEPGT
jgi:hypothetical protein